MALAKGKAMLDNRITAVLCGTAIMALMCATLICIAPLLILNGNASQNSIAIIGIFIQLISSVAGSLVAGLMNRQNKWFAIAASCGLFYLMLICCAMLLFNGISNKILFGLFACGGGALLSIWILHRNQKTQNMKIKKRRHR